MSDKAGKDSQYMVSRHELGSDQTFGSDWESGCDNLTRLVGSNRVRVTLISLNHLIKIIYQKHAVALHFSWHKILFKYVKRF